MTTETITWHAVTDCLPDADITVLLFFQRSEDDVCAGWFEDDQWRDSDGMPVYGVTHWADMPSGPRPVDLTQHVIGVPV